MSPREPASLRSRKIESLKAHQEYLRLLRDHHQEWIDKTDDPAICRLHLDILESIKQMEDRNRILLDALQNAPR
jgi:deoxyadenosine/deoxycytidine kinase